MSVACLAERAAVSVLVRVYTLSAADIEAATPAALTAEILMLRFLPTGLTVAAPVARMRRTVEPVKISSPVRIARQCELFCN